MKANRTANRRLSPGKLLLLSAVALGISASASFGAVTCTTTLGTVSLPYFTTPNLDYAYTDGTLAAVNSTGNDLVFTVAASTDLTTNETLIIYPATGFQFDPTAGDYTVATTTGATLSVSATTSALTITATSGASSNGTITISVFPMACSDGTVSAISSTAMPSFAGTANITASSPGNMRAIAGPTASFSTPSGCDSTDLADGDGGAEYTAEFTITDGAAPFTSATYSLWWSTDSELVDIAYDDGGHQAINDSDADITSLTDASTSQVVNTQYLPAWEREGVEWYLYIISNVSGTHVLAKGGPIRVFHYPTNGYDPISDASTTAIDPTSTEYVDSGGYYSSSGTADGSGSDNTDLTWQAIDYDDNAHVSIWYSTDATLTESDLVLSGSEPNEVVTALTGATLVTNSDTLRENEQYNTFNWDIYTSASNYVPEGNYYMYIVSNDGINQDVDVSAGVLHVTHSPTMNLADAVSGYTDDLYPNINRYYTVNWGTTYDGDLDPDDSCTISIYIDSDDSNDGNADFYQGTVSTLMATSTATDHDITNGELIVSGLSEDNDGQLRNLYDIDMWALNETLRADINDEIASAGAADLHIYAVISDGTINRLVAIGDGSDNFVSSGENITEIDVSNAQDAFITDPPDLGAAVSWGESYQVRWDFAWDFGEDHQNILLYLGNANYTGTMTWSGLSAGVAHLWVMNSSDGTVAHNSGSSYVISGLSYDGSFDFRPELMTGSSVGSTGGSALSAVGSGDYYVYLICSSNASGSAPASTDLVFKAPGTLRINNVSTSTPPTLGLEMRPSNLTMMKGDTTTFYIYPYNTTAEMCGIYMRVDTTYLGITTPSSPFTTNTSTFTGTVLENDNHGGAVSEGYYLLDYAYWQGSSISNFDGSHYLCTLSLYAKANLTGNPVDAFVWFDQNSEGDHACVFYDGNGNPLPCTVQTPAATINSYPLGEIAGNVNLQGCNNMAVTATLNLRRSGAQHGLEYWDSYYAGLNDEDSSTEGVQVTLSSTGHFHLEGIEDGEYDLTVHVDGWLNGTVDVQVQHGDHNTNYDPHYTNPNNSSGTDRLHLLAGDCAGYTDSTGTTRPDNQIDATDKNALVNAYQSTPDSSSWNVWCDYNRDNTVYIDDMALLNANIGSSGVWIVYRSGGDNSATEYSFANVPREVHQGDVIDVDVIISNAADVRAYDAQITYDSDLLNLLNIQQTDFIPNADYIQKIWGNRIVLAGAMEGRDYAGAAGSSVLATLRFEARTDGKPEFNFVKGMVINSADESAVPAFHNANAVPENYQLFNNYPNPFNPSTHIDFLTPVDGKVKLAVYNVLGQEIARLVDDNLQAGSYHFTWDGTNHSGQRVASGVYFYRLEANNFVATRKMIMLK